MDPATQGVPGYFVWEVTGQPVAIHLRLDVVDRMAAEILRGFGSVPKRGAEVGGILVGVIASAATPGDASIVRIEDFEPVPCKYVRGPSYLLTEYERMLFDEVCERRSPANAGHTYAVGYYRSHTRDGFTLEPEDIDLLDQHFRLPAQVALLVKPLATKPGVGGFFVRKNGVFPASTPLEFPFRRWEMTGEEPPSRASTPEKKDAAPGMRPERIVSAEPEEPPQEARAPKRPKSRAGIWMVGAFVFLLLGVLLGYEASRITAPRRASDFTLSLAVERTGENLTVRWNPGSPAIRSASNGVLEIDDGGETKRVELDRANLSGGSMVYRNTSDKIHFRLIAYLDTGLSVAQALDWPR
jgi:hypothetical protein